MRMIVGLGNPGPKYEATRHNAGFIILDLIAEHFGLNWSGKKFEAQVSKGRVFGKETLLVKPETFMNLSGKSVARFSRFYKIQTDDVIVLHDDIDMDFGKVKTRMGGGHGGHNGIRSIISEIGSNQFARVKIGVGRPDATKQGVSDWVLGSMSDSELIALQESIFEESLSRIKGIIEVS